MPAKKKSTKKTTKKKLVSTTPLTVTAAIRAQFDIIGSAWAKITDIAAVEGRRLGGE